MRVINPIIFSLGGWQIHLFTASIALLAGVTIGWLLWTARRIGESPVRWLDAALGLTIGGLIGGRAGHVILEWAYFSAQPDQIASLGNGGFDWHGALLIGLPGALLIGHVRRIRLGAFCDALAVTIPLGVMAVWSACGGSACAYGQEVRTLADYPGWLAVESPDVYGQIAPRLNLPGIGVWFGLLVLIAIIFILWRRWFSGQRLWIAITIVGAGQAIIDQFRGDEVAIWAGRRADQWLDIGAFILSIAIIVVIGANQRRMDGQRKGQTDESNDRAGTDVSENRGRGRKSRQTP